MASTSQSTFYARPVFLGSDEKKPQRFHKHAPTMDTSSKSNKTVTFVTPKNGRFLKSSASGLNRRHLSENDDTSKTRHSEIESSAPPPRPPPPRPKRLPKQGESQRGMDGRSQSQGSVTTPEPKPLTRTNVTDHDRLWRRDDDEEDLVSDVLTPPLQYLTPQVTEDMMKNFDPLDMIDSTSDHSDSSADTMIMMTTEEERKNMERIYHSQSQYTSVKSKTPDSNSTNKLKVDIQNKKSHFVDRNGLSAVHGDSLFSDSDVHSYNRVKQLHIKTDTDAPNSSPESEHHKSGSHEGSPHDDSPDDGYGTNSSSGTVSSPFSSSFGSTDLEHSSNGPFKKGLLPNGVIKPNSVRESWAVKRKQRMIEAADNSVQEQLRQLTIIEEESGGQVSDNGLHRLQPAVTGRTTGGKSRYGVNVTDQSSNKVNKVDNKLDPSIVLRQESGNENSNLDLDPEVTDSPGGPFVNVSSRDLVRRSGQLYVIDSSSPQVLRRAEPSHSGTAMPPPVPPHLSPNEITAPRIPPHCHYNTSGNITSGNGERIYDQVYEPHSVGLRAHVPSYRDDCISINSEAAASSDGPPLLRGGSELQRTLSGKIYVSPTGDEGFYSLNRSSRSTSVSSFQQVNDSMDCSYYNDTIPPPRSPLEVMSDDMLEKWSEMDINYRNYYGFDEQVEKFSRTDSKINYFQEKKINTMYSQDNYYRPQNYPSEVTQALQSHIGAQPPSHIGSQPSPNQGTTRDLRQESSTSSETPSRSSTQKSHKGAKSSKDSGSKSKLFQILPNMFKPTKKQNSDNKTRQQPVQDAPVPVPVNVPTHMPEDPSHEAEYINVGDLPQYSVAALEYEEKLKKGQFVSLESLMHKRPVFASSKDINKLFSHHDQSFDSIHHPGAQRHSFHAMPLSYRHMNTDSSAGDSMRPRAQSTSATVRNQQIRSTVETRMALISRKNAAVMNHARQVTGSSSNLSLHSNLSNPRTGSTRSRRDSGSSGGDSRLSTLV